MIKLRCKLPINNSWNGFLPNNAEDWLKFTINFGNDNADVAMGISDVREDLDMIEDLPDNVGRWIIPGKNMTIIIDAKYKTNIENMLLELDATEFSKMMKTDNELIPAFQNASKEMINIVYGEVYGLIRNQFYQYWLHNNDYYTENYLQTAEWKNSHGKWINVFPPTISRSSRIRLDGLKKNDWEKLESLLNAKKKFQIHTFLISNASMNLENHNYRMAIVEIVTALESVLKIHLSKSLTRNVFCFLDEDKVDKAVEKMGLRLSSELFLQYLGNKYEVDEQIVKNCLDGIDIRNNVIHQNQKNVEAEKAKKIIESIKTIVEKIISEVEDVKNKENTT